MFQVQKELELHSSSISMVHHITLMVVMKEHHKFILQVPNKEQYLELVPEQ